MRRRQRRPVGQPNLPVIRRGSATVIALMLVLSVMTLGLFTSAATLQTLRNTRLRRNSACAFALAESAVERGVLWLRDQSVPPTQTAAFDPLGGSVSLGGGSYSVQIDGDDTNPTVFLKRYVLTGTGTMLGRTEKVELLVRMASFGDYAFFFDRWDAGLVMVPELLVEGPAHTNGSGGTRMNVIWSTTDTTPIFKGLVTTAAASINYPSPRAPSSEADYLRIFEDGSSGYRLGTRYIPLPAGSNAQRDAAWGATSGFPTTTGAYINTVGSSALGGIYICGDANQVHFSIDGVGNQVITVVQGSTTTVFTVDRMNNQTTRRVGSTTTTYVGSLNGVLYCTGNILSLRGDIADSYVSGSTVNRNAWTVATDSVSGKDTVVTGNIYYRTRPNNNEPWDSATNRRAGCLGLVTDECQIGSAAPTNLWIDAVMVCGGSTTTTGQFWAPTYASKRPQGTVDIFGGCIAYKAGATATTSGTGWNDSYHYDERLKADPPPYFPTTGAYDRLSWRRLRATGS